MRRSPRVTLFIERSGLNFLFYKGNSVTCLVTKNSSSRIPPCNRSLSSFKKTYDFISLASVTISRHNFLCGAAERMRTDRHNVHWIKKEKEKIIPPVKDYMHEKDIFRWLHSEFSFFFYVFFFFLFRLQQFRTRICTRAPASRAFFKKKKNKVQFGASNCIKLRQVVTKPWCLHPKPSSASGHYRPHPSDPHCEMKNLRWTCVQVLLWDS